MRTTKKVKLPARMVDEHSYTCDRCGAPCGEDEKHGHYEAKKVTIICEEGTVYPDDVDIECTTVDCCVACFREHVLPDLEALGFKPRTGERTW